VEFSDFFIVKKSEKLHPVNAKNRFALFLHSGFMFNSIPFVQSLYFSQSAPAVPRVIKKAFDFPISTPTLKKYKNS